MKLSGGLFHIIVVFAVCVVAAGQGGCKKKTVYPHDFNRMAGTHVWNAQVYFKEYIYMGYHTHDTTTYGLDTFEIQVISNSSVTVLGNTLDYTSSTDSTMVFSEEQVPQGPYSRLTLYYNYKANSILVEDEEYTTHQLNYRADYTTH